MCRVLVEVVCITEVDLSCVEFGYRAWGVVCITEVDFSYAVSIIAKSGFNFATLPNADFLCEKPRMRGCIQLLRRLYLSLSTKT